MASAARKAAAIAQGSIPVAGSSAGKRPLPGNFINSLRNASMSRHRYVAVPPTSLNTGLLSILLTHGFITSVSYGSTNTSSLVPPDPASFREVPLPDRRIWAELKYRADRPVLNEFSLISKGSRRIHMAPEDLRRFVKGNRVHFIPGLTLGEVAIVRNDEGLYEAREAIRRGVGGEVIARVK